MYDYANDVRTGKIPDRELGGQFMTHTISWLGIMGALCVFCKFEVICIFYHSDTDVVWASLYYGGPSYKESLLYYEIICINRRFFISTIWLRIPFLFVKWMPQCTCDEVNICSGTGDEPWPAPFDPDCCGHIVSLGHNVLIIFSFLQKTYYWLWTVNLSRLPWRQFSTTCVIQLSQSD